MLARRALAALVSLSRGALLAVMPEVAADAWLRNALRDAGPDDVTVLGCFATRNRAQQEWPCCVVRVHRASRGLGHPERTELVAAFFGEDMALRVQRIGEVPRRFLGSKGGRPGVLNGDGPAETSSSRPPTSVLTRTAAFADSPSPASSAVSVPARKPRARATAPRSA